MKSKKKDEFDGKVTSWTQKLGVSIIGLLTALGAGLIVYTGVMAATYEQPKSENDYLTYDKVEVETSDDSIDVNQDTSVDQKQEEVTPPATDSSMSSRQIKHMKLGSNNLKNQYNRNKLQFKQIIMRLIVMLME